MELWNSFSDNNAVGSYALVITENCLDQTHKSLYENTTTVSLEQTKIHQTSMTTYLTDDPLWDGEQCTGDSQCCHDPGMPWFSRQFSSAITGDIEARICRDQIFADEGISIDQLQLFVQ